MEDLNIVVIILVIIAIVAIALIFHRAFEWIDSSLGISISGQVSPIVPIIIVVAITMIAVTIVLLGIGNKGKKR